MSHSQKSLTAVTLLGTSWFWISQITSVIGLISIVEDLKLWSVVIGSLLTWLKEVLPQFAAFLSFIGDSIHPVLELFRGFFRPLFDFLFQWLPFDVPQLVKDGFIVAVFVGLGQLRNNFRYMRLWDKARTEELVVLQDAAVKAGVKVAQDPRSWASDSANALKRAIEAHRSLSQNHSWATGSMKNHWREVWSAAEETFGKNIQAFATSYNEHQKFYHKSAKILEDEDRAVFFVWAFGAATALLIAVDWFFFR